MQIRDYIQWQDATDLDAFITKLTDSEERVRQNIRQYVVGDKVKERLDQLLKAVGERLDDNRDIGRYIHGAFGSGKSNLLTVLGKMLERDETVYDLGHAALREMRARHPWLDRHKTLVVRINMMGQASLVRALYHGYNQALPAGLPRPMFTDEERVFELIDRDAERLGGMDKLLAQAAADQAVTRVMGLSQGMPPALFVEYYGRLRGGDADKRLALAAALQNWRNHGQDPIGADDLWVDARTGLDRIARHAREHSYTAIAWLVDELVIWIRGKSRSEYVTQLNHLSAMVDHDAARVLPFFVAVAVQMDIARTCPEDLSENDFHAQFGFIRDRFQPQLDLEDQDLYEVAAQRVLARRKDLKLEEIQAFEGAVDAAFTKHGEAIGRLSGGLPMDLVRRLYPFNPALLRILIDVTQALSRNRTAIAALYRLLNRHADLAVGQFIPVGALWDFVFEPENVAYVKQNTTSRLCQRMAETYATYIQMEGKLDAIAMEASAEPQELRQLVRTVLLCQLSDRPYFPDGRPLAERITASTLLHLNQTDVRALTERTGIAKIARLFRQLSGAAPHVEVLGDAANPIISIKVEQLNIDKILDAARGDVDHSKRFAYIRRVLIEQLGLDLGTGNEGGVDLVWRGTRRRGKVRLANVRHLSYAGQNNEFDPLKDDFLILIDYPFDEEPGRNRADDLETVRRARARSTQWTLAWLPEHFTPNELRALGDAAAVDLISRDPARFFDNYSPRDAEAAGRALQSFQANRKAELEEAVRRVFFKDGLVEGMKGALENISVTGLDRARSMETLGAAIMSARYPNHPNLKRKITATDLSTLADWVIRAAKTGQTIDLKSADMGLVDAFVEPLQVGFKAPSGLTPRSDGRYLGPILDWVGARREIDAQELRARLMDGEEWQFGLSREVADFFLYYLLQVSGFEALEGGKSTTIHGVGKLPDRFKLVKEEVVDAPTWDRARRVADLLLGVKGRAELPTPPEQAKLSRDVEEAALALVTSVRQLWDRLREVGTWAGITVEASARARAAAALQAELASLIHERGPAARCRRLAALYGSPDVAEHTLLRANLERETAALAAAGSGRLAFEHLRRTGSQEDHDAVVLRLQNLLRDPLTAGTLNDRLAAWHKEAQRRFEAQLKREEDAAQQLKAARLAQAEAELRAKQAAEERAREMAAHQAQEAKNRQAQAEMLARLAQAEQAQRDAEAAAKADKARLAELEQQQAPPPPKSTAPKSHKAFRVGALPRDALAGEVERRLREVLADLPDGRLSVSVVVEGEDP